MPVFATLQPLSHDPLAIVLLALQGTSSADDWNACETFWNKQLETLPGGSGLYLARSEAAGEGERLAQALANVSQTRVLIVPACPEYLQADLIPKLSARLDQAHVVSLVRREFPPGVLMRILRGSLGLMARVLLALDPGPTPGWPGWRRWSERAVGWWSLGMRGCDPFAPCKMVRSCLIPTLALQSTGSLVHGELVAKANFLGALLDEERFLGEGKRPAEPVDLLWWRDYFRLCNRPVFGAAVQKYKDLAS